MSQISTHSPTLATVRMIEETLRNAKEVITVAELKRRLPKQVNNTTLRTVLIYLYESGKIIYAPGGILWTYTPPAQLAEILAKGRTW